MLGIPTSVEAVNALTPVELRETCRALRLILDFCAADERAEDRFDRDELGIDPEDDYDDEE